MENKQQQALKAFLERQHHSLTPLLHQQPLHNIKARILSPQDLQTAATNLQKGQLVAFPTETVYGLGANALNQTALRLIYTTKKRPLSDPIIVHVLDEKQAQQLAVLKEEQKLLFGLLVKKFWPGPLTIIVKANQKMLPLIVTAQTGFVGIRSPKHPYARKLIQAVKLPIGAPSANLFSHVSPTEPVHVFNDFYDCSISIVDGDRCEFGVESTVIKLVEGQIHVLREGSLSINKLQSFLKENITESKLPAVIIHRKVANKNTNMQAPGQSLKHYAPYLPCYWFDGERKGTSFINKTSHKFSISETAFISFDSEKYHPFKGLSKHYFEVGTQLRSEQKEKSEELFCSKEEQGRMREIYYLLRRCQNLGVSAIVVGWSGDKEGTVWDKIFRSTQGEQVLCIQ